MKKSKLLWYFTGFLFTINILEYFTKLGGEKVLLIFSDSLPIVCAAVSVICLYSAFKGFKTFDFAKKAWMCILIGISLNLVAETIYSTLEIFFGYDMNQMFPSVADIFWWSAYVAIFWGLLMMFLGYRRSGFPMGNTKLYFVLAALYIFLFTTVTYFLLLPILNDEETSWLTKFASMFYPLADSLVVIPAIILMYIISLFGKGIISRPWKYLAIGFMFFTGSDLVYSYLSWQDTYGSGNLIDLGWNLGYLLIGIAALYQRELVDSLKGGRA
jgi:hypothetical protein